MLTPPCSSFRFQTPWFIWLWLPQSSFNRLLRFMSFSECRGIHCLINVQPISFPILWIVFFSPLCFDPRALFEVGFASYLIRVMLPSIPPPLCVLMLGSKLFLFSHELNSGNAEVKGNLAFLLYGQNGMLLSLSSPANPSYLKYFAHI